MRRVIGGGKRVLSGEDMGDAFTDGRRRPACHGFLPLTKYPDKSNL